MTSLKIAVGTFFGTGFLPKAPGTWGSLCTLPVVYATGYFFGSPGLYFFTGIAVLLSLWSASAVEKAYGPDPSVFVMDEVAGQSLVFLITGLYLSVWSDFLLLTGGFLLFRFFDITKPLGINALQKLPGKFGILADDLLAGLYSLVLLEGLYFVLATYA